jgi:hypothetical protein
MGRPIGPPSLPTAGGTGLRRKDDGVGVEDLDLEDLRDLDISGEKFSLQDLSPHSGGRAHHFEGWKRQGMRARYAVSPDLMKQMREALARIEVPPFVGRIEDDTSVPAPR